MAKSVAEIQAEMDAEYQQAYNLDGTQMSNASDWKTFRGIFANLCFLLYSFFDSYKKEVSDLASATEFATKVWWRKTLLEFQLDTPLVVDNGKVGYAVVDASKQIIKRAAIAVVRTNTGKKVLLKVATEIDGVPSPIEEAQQTQLDFYVQERTPPGIDTQIVNLPPDEVKVNEVIYYDGKLDLSNIQEAVMTSRKAYLSNIVFDGQFNINKYRDALEAVSGVVDTSINGVSIKPNDGNYSAVIRTYDPVSGYYILKENECVFNFIAQ